MWALVTVLLWLLEIVVWWAVVIPLIVRPLGIRLPLWRFPKAAVPLGLGRWGYVIVEGVLKWGVGIWLFFSTADYIGCRFARHFASCKTVGLFFIDLAECMFVGFVVGLARWARRGQRLASPD